LLPLLCCAALLRCFVALCFACARSSMQFWRIALNANETSMQLCRLTFFY